MEGVGGINTICYPLPVGRCVGDQASKCNVVLTKRDGHDFLNRLPPELLHEIFVLCMSYSAKEKPRYIQGPDKNLVCRALDLLYSMQSVCRYWRRVFLNTPSFWLNIEVYCDTTSSKLEQLLRRSAAMPLKISLMDAEHLLSHLEQHMHRIQRLCLTFLVGCVEKVDTLLSVPLFATPAPILEGLHLTFDANTNLSKHAFVPRLFDNTARLTRAYFKRCLPWPHNTFPHLTHIFVGCAYAAYNNPPIAEVLDFLEGSPNLEEVVLDGVKVGDLPPSQSSRIVSLPCLRSVVLDNCESLLECFIGHVIPSETVALRCDWFDDAPKGATWRFDILQSGAPFFSRIGPVKELSFWTTDYVCGEFCFACRDLVGCVTFNAVLGYSLTIDDDDDILEAVLEYLAQRFDLSTVDKLRLQVARVLDRSYDALYALLLATPTAASLTVFVFEDVDEEGLIWLLADDDPPLLPQLKHVRVAKHNETLLLWMPTSVLDVAMERAELGYPLRSLTCTAISSEPEMVPLYGWDPESVTLDGDRVMDYVDELVLDRMDDDRRFLDRPEPVNWNGRM